MRQDRLLWTLSLFVLLLILGGCQSESSGDGGSWISAVRSDRTMLAKRLESGKLGPAESDEAAPDARVADDSEIVEEAEEAEGVPGRSNRRPRHRVSAGPSAPSAAPTGGSTSPAPAKVLDAVSADLLVRSGGEVAEHADAPQPLIATSWKRSAERFVRVEVGRDEKGAKTLKLAKLRVTVRIDGHRARTVVDHVFENPFDKQLEGRFTYPLPSGASACYYGMFLSSTQAAPPPLFDGARIAELPEGGLTTLQPDDVVRRVDDRWGKLREARIVPREQGRRVYEEIVRKKIDPALLEKESGNRFVGRVFPIPPKGFNRVVLAWEEELVEGSDGAFVYRLPLPAQAISELQIEASTTRAAWKLESFESPGKPARKELTRDVLYSVGSEGKALSGGIAWRLVPKDARVQCVSGADSATGLQAFSARLRPELPEQAAGSGAKHGVFLVDTSLSEDPERFAIHARMLREILERDEQLARVQVICFDVGAWCIGGTGWLDNDAATRARLAKTLDAVLLEGATDLSAAVALLAELPPDGAVALADKRPLSVFFLSNGEVTWGDGDARRLAERASSGAHWEPTWYCYRSGVGAENLQLFDALVRRGGAIFQVPDEEAARRVATAHRKQRFVIDRISALSDAGEARDLVVRGRAAAIPAGGDLVLAGHVPAAARKGTITIEGRMGSAARLLRVPVAFGQKSELAGRAWAVLATEQMLGLDDPRVDRLATAYAQRYRIGTRATSFLVLETDEEYEQYELQTEAEALKVDDVRDFLSEAYRVETATSPRVALGRFLRGTSERTKQFTGPAGQHVRDVFARVRDADFELPRLASYGELPTKAAVATRYLQRRAKDRRDFKNYVRAAELRLGDERDFLALRALSSIVELEPSRSDALRLVGYRFLGLGRPAYATTLFERIRDARPFEPHGYRDLARSYERLGKTSLAALHYELVLAGSWNERFKSMKTVARDEYRRLIRGALRREDLAPGLASTLRARAQSLGGEESKPRLRVTISWNTDNTDVDLWVVEPSGEACGYENMKTKSGGRLLDDLTGGYGPERYEHGSAPSGECAVLVKYFGDNPNLIGNETQVEVVVTRDVGRASERQVSYDVVLDRENQAVEVCRIRT